MNAKTWSGKLIHRVKPYLLGKGALVSRCGIVYSNDDWRLVLADPTCKECPNPSTKLRRQMAEAWDRWPE